jgi:hydroxymethylglutaryl-CoA synthase
MTSKKEERDMVGIISYGAYVPLWRLTRGVITPGAQGEKAICGFDEDSITMAVAATLDCLSGIDRKGLDALFFATTTPPYIEKMGAPIVALASDLRRDITTTDFANSLRSGTCAIKAAVNAVKADSAEQVIVAASDCRRGVPRTSLDEICGDGAGALLIGDKDVAVSVEATYSISDEIIDIWRVNGDTFLRYWEERFTSTEGYLRVVAEAVSGLMKKCGYSPHDFAKVVFYTPDGRRVAELAKMLGFDLKNQVQDPLFNVMGNTGAAYPVMLLIAALEEAKAGDRILLASYGNGSDAFVLQVTDQIEKIRNRRGMKGHLTSKRVINDYLQYLRWREILPKDRERKDVEFISAPAIWREREAIYPLHGVRCKACKTTQYPPQRVCTVCKAKDQFESCRLSDKRAKIFTFSMDYIKPTPEPPTVTTTIEFEGGGRMECYMTDRDIKEVKVDLPVEMTFRKLEFVDGIHNYFWKSTPPRTVK